MKVAVATSLLAKRYMYVNACHQDCKCMSYNCKVLLSTRCSCIFVTLVDHMRFFISFFTLLLCTAVIVSGGALYAKVNVLQYDSSIVINENYLAEMTDASMDSVMANHDMLSAAKPVVHEQIRAYEDSSFDFYLLLGLVIFFGLIRYTHPRYFQYLVRAFRSPSFGSKQLKEQMETSFMPNFLMNIFFAASAGVYLYYIFKLNFPQRYSVFSPSLLVLVLIAGLGALYITKQLVMSFSGWVFNSKSMTGHYMYNVLLINKVISIILLPFTILLAFAQHDIAVPAMILSLFLIGVLFINRYIRSWQVLGAFFQYNKFHFFAYLCASELLPMAILTKLLIRGIYY